MVRHLLALLPDPSNLAHPSRTGIEAGPDPGAAPVDGVGPTLETGTGDGGQALGDHPGPAETPGQVDPDPEVLDPEAGARRNELSWEAAALNPANPTRLIPRFVAGTAGRLGAISAAHRKRGRP